jgi:hypothetical protein
MKIRTVGAELLHAGKGAERRTDTTKLFAILRTRLKTCQFINMPKFPLGNVKQHEYNDINEGDEVLQFCSTRSSVCPFGTI